MSNSAFHSFLADHKRMFQRWAVAIMTVSVLAAAGTYFVMGRKQTYSAYVNIKFLNSAASNGYAFDGTKTEDDINEIQGAEVLSQGIALAGMSDAITPNEVTPNLTITAVIPDDEQKKIDSALDNGKEYEYYPVEYRIALTTKYPSTGRLLSYIAEAYETYFAQNHTGLAALPADMSTAYSESYDFIELADLFDSHISAMKGYAESEATALPSFRSSTNGYAYADLAAEYDRLSTEDIPRLYAAILSAKASKDPTLLRQKLEAKKQSNSAENADTEATITKLERLIATYSEKNKANGTVSNGFGDLPTDDNRTNIMNGVYENTSNPKSAYDSMFATYSSENDSVSFNNIDSAFADYLLSVYEDVTAPADAETASELTAQIKSLMEAESKYYKIAQEMKTDSDQISAASMIQIMNTPVAERAIRVKLYSAIAFAAAFLLMCVLLPAGYMLKKNVETKLLEQKGN